MSMFSSINQAYNSSLKTLKSNKIEKIVFGGSGLTHKDGCVIFVPFSAPGDEVTLKIIKEKKSYKIAQIDHLNIQSKDRIQPRCPYFQKCGGCQFQHLAYQAQLKAKQSFITEALGLDVRVLPAPVPWLYRSHIRLNLRKQKKGFTYGFIGTDNHSLISITSCSLFSEDKLFFNQLKSYLSSLSNKGIKTGSLQIFKLNHEYILAFSFFPCLPKELPSFPLAKGTVFKSPGNEVVLGQAKIKKTILGHPIEFSPYSFMQNNHSISEKLYQTMIEWIGAKPKKILDLYCGAGVTSTLLSKKGHTVIGVDSNKDALKEAKGAQFICSNVEHILTKLLKTFKPDMLIVNPTRKGLSKKVRSLLDAQEVFYISCMPSTLKRDLYTLKELLFIKRALSFDMFPQTTHLETLVQLTHK